MRSSVASAADTGRAARRERWVFLGLWSGLLLIKVWLALHLPAFDDEAWYWRESRRLDYAYSDLPPATAWLIRAGTALAGDTTLGLRLGFLILGALLPLYLARAAARLAPDAGGSIAALAWLLLPLGGSLGLLALPDVPLTCAALLALSALIDAVREDRRRDWITLGLALAAAWLSHYRAGLLLAAGLAFLLVTAQGRALWRRPGLWLALGLATLGLVPVLVHNALHDWAGLSFQVVERNPWTFHADALVQPVEQALVVTPLLYLLLLGVLWRAWRRRAHSATDALLGSVGGSLLLAYFLLGLVADDTRFRVHWPLPGYLAALLLLPAYLRGARRGVAVWSTAALALAGVGLALTLAYLGAAAQARVPDVLVRSKAFPDNFVGWNEAADAARRALAAQPQALLVGDSFIVAAELDFALRGERPVWSLDAALNRKHGRAAQLAWWGLDEAGLRTHPDAPVVLVVNATGTRERQRAEWLASLCTRVAELRLLDTVTLYGGRKIFKLYAGRVPRADETLAPCD